MFAIIIQARMSSQRTPGKTMELIQGRPLLWYSVNRSLKSEQADQVIVATTTNPCDDCIVSWCTEQKIACFRGNEDDVLDRYYQAASAFGADVIARVTSDCPFIDSVVIDTLYEKLVENHVDYASNRIKRRTWPHGLDVEIMTYHTLKYAWEHAREKSEREHVTPYIRNHPDLFSLYEYPLPEDLSFIRLTVDYPEDLNFTRTFMEKNPIDTLSWKDIVNILKKNPALMEINAKWREESGKL